MPPSACLSDEQLSLLAGGILSEADAAPWEAHLLGCETCLERTRVFHHADTVVAALQAGRSRGLPAPDSPVVQRLMERLMNRQALSQPAPLTATTQDVESPTVGPGVNPVTEPLPSSLLPPNTQLGPYRIDRTLGQGGMGAVYLATHVKLQKTVALKLLSRKWSQPGSAVARFEREMRAVGKLSHPHIVQAFDAGEVDGHHYLAMEYIEGSDLQVLVREHGVFSVVNACKAIRQTALALVAAHAAGLVHRDLKPSNLLVGKNGQVKLLDLGLALLSDEADDQTDLTSAGQTFGTADYMAPEQWEDAHAADARTDLYALGCTLYFLLVGHAPYGGKDQLRTPVAKMKAHVTAPIPDLRAARPDLPEGLVAIYERLMAKAPAERFQTAAELAEALAPFASNKTPPAAPPAPPVAAPTLVEVSAPTLEIAPSCPRRPSRPRAIGLAAAGGAALLLLGLIVITIRNKDGQETVLRVPEGTEIDVAAAPGSQVTIRQEGSGTKPGMTTSETKPADTGWQGWPADAPKPAIAPFDAEQAKRHQEAWAAYLKLPVEYTNSLGMKFVLIPPGEFMMGCTPDEIERIKQFLIQNNGPDDPYTQNVPRACGPQHTVVLTKPFYLCTCEVTQSQFSTVAGRNPSFFVVGDGVSFEGDDPADFPVDTASWADAAEFCAKLSTTSGLKSRYFRSGEKVTLMDGNGYRLPTEAEWEFSGRAGTVGPQWYGPDQGTADWNVENSGQRPHPVGQLKANPFGLHDIHGNVYEFVQDFFDVDLHQSVSQARVVDPSGPAVPEPSDKWMSDGYPVRGGGFNHPLRICGVGQRQGSNFFGNNTGFRIALGVESVRKLLNAPPTEERATTFPKVAFDPTPPKPLGTWEMGPEPEWFQEKAYSLRESEVLPGAIERPAKLPGIKRWNVGTVAAGTAINVIRASPDGKWVATGANDGHVRIHDATTLAVVGVLPGRGGQTGVYDIAWHPDSERLAVACDGATILRIWSRTGELLVEERLANCVSLAWNREGTRLAVGFGAAVGLEIRGADGRLLRRFPGREDGATAQFAGKTVWTVDEQSVITAHLDGKLRLWNPETGQAEVFADLGPEFANPVIALSRDGWLAVGNSKEIRLFDPNRKPARTIPANVTSLAWSLDGTKLHCGEGYSWIDIDRETGERLGSREVLFGVNHPAVLPDGTICFWNSQTLQRANPDELERKVTAPRGSFRVHGLAWSPDGQSLASASMYFGPVRLWSATGAQVRCWNQTPEILASWLAWHPDGSRFMAGGGDDRLHSLSRGGPPEPWKGVRPLYWRGSFAWSPDGEIGLIGLSNGHVQVVDRTGKSLAKMPTGGQGDCFPVWQPGRNRILVTTPGRLPQFCDPTAGWTLQPAGDTPLPPHQDPPVWSSDGKTFSVWGAGWFDEHGQKLDDINSPPALAWQRDGEAYLGTPNGVLTWFTPDGTPLRNRLANHWEDRFAFRPQGDLFASGGPFSPRITAWRTADLQPHWHALMLDDGKAATFSAAGELLNDQPEELDALLVYYLDRGDGRIETLTPAAFRQLVAAGKAAAPPAGDHSRSQFPKVAFDPTPPKPLGTWEMGPEPEWFQEKAYSLRESEVLPGAIERPAKLPGIKRWNVGPVAAGTGINVIRVSPDGKWVATGAGDGHVRIHDATTLAVVRVLPGRGGQTGVSDLAWHPDGERLAVACDSTSTLRIWSRTGETLAEERLASCVALAWNREGTRLALGFQAAGGLEIRAEDGRLLRRVAGREDAATAQPSQNTVWTADGKSVITASYDGKLRLWHPETGQADVFADLGPEFARSIIALSRDGWLAVANNKEIRLFDPNRKPARTIPASVTSLAWSLDGTKLHFGEGYWWIDIDRETGERLGSREVWLGVNHPAVLPDGTICFSNDGGLQRANPDELERKVTAPRNSFVVAGLAWSPDGQALASASMYFGPVRLWSATGSQVRCWDSPPILGYRLAWHPEGTHFLTGTDNGMHVLSKEGPTRRIEGLGQPSFNDFPAWSPDGEIGLIGYVNGHSKVVDRTGKSLAKQQTGPTWGGGFLVWQPGRNRFVVTTIGRPPLFCDPSTGWTLHPMGETPLPPHGEPPVWSPDGKTFSIWDVGWFDEHGQKLDDPNRPPALAWQPDGEAYVSTPNGIPTWLTPDGTPLRTRRANHWEDRFAFRPQGDLFASGGGASPRITAWRTADLQPHWHALLLDDGKAATFSAAGELLSDKPEDLDPLLVYYLDRGDGRIETLTPAAFRQLVAAGKAAAGPAAPH